MAYFDQNRQEEEYTSVFQKTYPEQPEEKQTEHFDDDEGIELLSDDYTEELPVTDDPEEEAEQKKERFKFIYGIGDFVGTIVGAVVILLLVAFLISLISWLVTDVKQTFTLWQNKL